MLTNEEIDEYLKEYSFNILLSQSGEELRASATALIKEVHRRAMLKKAQPTLWETKLRALLQGIEAPRIDQTIKNATVDTYRAIGRQAIRKAFNHI